MIYVLVDCETGEEIAFHIENGPTLKRWKKDAESRGRSVKIVAKDEEGG